MQENVICISKVANGFAVQLPAKFNIAERIDFNDPEQYGKALGNAMKKYTKDDLLEGTEEKKVPVKSPAIATDENLFIFSELDEAMKFIEFKLKH